MSCEFCFDDLEDEENISSLLTDLNDLLNEPDSYMDSQELHLLNSITTRANTLFNSKFQRIK